MATAASPERTLDEPVQKPRGKWPAPDAQIVMPGTRYEILDGELRYVPPAKPPHAERHFQLTSVLAPHVADGYLAACDMLTRVSEDSDIAPDAAIRKVGIDPETGGRYLEELAFEVAASQTVAVLRRRAELLSARGVRGVYAIVLKRDRVLRWNPSKSDFDELEATDRIEDPALDPPLPVAALLKGANVHALAVHAYEQRQDPALMTLLEKRGEAGRELGREEERAQAIADVLQSRGVPVTDAEAERLLALRGRRVLDRAWRCALTCERVDELFAVAETEP